MITLQQAEQVDKILEAKGICVTIQNLWAAADSARRAVQRLNDLYEDALEAGLAAAAMKLQAEIVNADERAARAAERAIRGINKLTPEDLEDMGYI